MGQPSPAISDADREAWLARNAIDCARYKSRISPPTCERYRLVDPINCKGCARLDQQAAEEVEQAKQLPGWVRVMKAKTTVRKAPGMTKKTRHKQDRKGVCQECGKEKTIIGRGRCFSCYQKARKIEAMTAVEQPPAVPATNDQTTQRYPLSAVKEAVAEPSIEQGAVMVPLAFVGDDLKLYQALQTLAAKDRRSVDNEILCIIENYLEDCHAGE